MDRTSDLSSWLRVGPRAVVALVTACSALACIAVLELLGWVWLSVGPISVGPVPALVAVGGLFAGPAAVVGTVAGYAGAQTAHGALSVWETLGVLVFGLTTWQLWRSVGPSPLDLPRRGTPHLLARFVVVVTVGALWGGGVIGWGHELTGQFSFFPVAPVFVLSSVASATVIGGAALPVVAWSADERLFSQIRLVQPPVGSRATADGWPTGIVAVSVAWFLLGSVVSIGFHLVDLVPGFYFRDRGIGALLVLTEAGLFGSSGRAVQAALGATCLVVLAASLWRRGRTGST